MQWPEGCEKPVNQNSLRCDSNRFKPKLFCSECKNRQHEVITHHNLSTLLFHLVRLLLACDIELRLCMLFDPEN